MTTSLETLSDLTQDVTFARPSPEAVDTLLEYGVVVTEGVVSPAEVEGVRQAVDTLYFETLHARIIYKILEAAPSAHVRDAAHHAHSKTSQFDPNRVPLRLSSAAPAIARIRALDETFFEDERIANLYAHQTQRLNVVDVSRARLGQKAFVPHQDSAHVGRLGHILQPTLTRWTIHGGHEPSRKNYDYTFTAPEGSVVTTLERVAPAPEALPPGQGLEYYIEDGSEVHSGDNLTDDIRHRLAVFAEQPLPEHRKRSRFVRALVSFESRMRMSRLD